MKNNNSWPFIGEIEHCLAKSDYKSCERLLLKALSSTILRKTRVSYLGLLASVLDALNKRDEAISLRKKALHLMPSDNLSRLSLARSLLENKYHLREIKLILKPLLRQRDISTRDLHSAYSLLGEFYLKIGKTKKQWNYF